MAITEPARSRLDVEKLHEQLGRDWVTLYYPQVGSTNTVAAVEVAAGRHGAHTLVVTDHQTQGRGRLARPWVTPPGAALTFSSVWDPLLPVEDWPLLPLGVALALADVLRPHASGPVGLKWPNDVQFGERKVAGILLERVSPPTGPPLAVVGVGVNVDMSPEELPTASATSLRLEGIRLSRETLLAQLVAAVAQRLSQLRADPATFMHDYRQASITVGRHVRVAFPDHTHLEGVAETIDSDGHLVVGGQVITAGDVTHATLLE